MSDNNIVDAQKTDIQKSQKGLVTFPSAKEIELGYLTLSAQTRKIPQAFGEIQRKSYDFKSFFEKNKLESDISTLEPDVYKYMVDLLPQELRKRKTDKYFYLCDQTIEETLRCQSEYIEYFNKIHEEFWDKFSPKHVIKTKEELDKELEIIETFLKDKKINYKYLLKVEKHFSRVTDDFFEPERHVFSHYSIDTSDDLFRKEMKSVLNYIKSILEEPLDENLNRNRNELIRLGEREISNLIKYYYSIPNINTPEGIESWYLGMLSHIKGLSELLKQDIINLSLHRSDEEKSELLIERLEWHISQIRSIAPMLIDDKERIDHALSVMKIYHITQDLSTRAEKAVTDYYDYKEDEQFKNSFLAATQESLRKFDKMIAVVEEMGHELSRKIDYNTSIQKNTGHYAKGI